MKEKFGEHLTQAARFKARFEFVKANRKTMTIDQMAAALGTARKTVQCYLTKLNKEEKPPKEAPVLRGYASWECHRERRLLPDNFGGWF